MKETSIFYPTYATIYSFVYSRIMRAMHYFNWHYAPPSYPEGDTHLWCHWCGFRQTVKRGNYKEGITGCDKASA